MIYLKKYLPLILIFLIVLSATVFINADEGYTEHYDDGEISFDYPQGWSIKPGSNPSEVVVFQPSNDSNVTVNKQVIPPGYQSAENYTLNTTEADNSGFGLISHKVRNISMNEAHENTYYINSQGNIYLRKEIWIPKNGNLYSIIYTHHLVSESSLKNETAKTNQYNGYRELSNDQTNIDFKSVPDELTIIDDLEIIVENFRVQSVSTPAKTPFWGNVSIPALNVAWGIRSDTVNGENSVFHYDESFYPGQNGTMGLLGHHTIHSAPFARISQLKTGDEVVINDYLSQKKYIYQVVSNGDIKWDYQTNPITFSTGNSTLTLVTCYPPGTTQAAWMVHCKLISIEPLN